uniref:Chromobox protein homolog 1 n=1 Tax=Cacopsylla melanoneura TaxID=428564 RepID=A0A8D8WZL2_9HEMI
MKTKVRGRRPRWSGPQMESAMNSVIVEGGSIQAAARLFNIPQCTLSKYVQHRTNKKPKRGPRIGWKRSSIEDPYNTNSGFGSPVKGIDRNLPVEQIIGASIELGFPAFLVTWEGSDEADLLPAELCKRKYPQPLIKFFEKHLTFPLD